MGQHQSQGKAGRKGEVGSMKRHHQQGTHPSGMITLSLPIQGEILVKDIFPEANIVRAGRLFGPEDRLLNW